MQLDFKHCPSMELRYHVFFCYMHNIRLVSRAFALARFGEGVLGLGAERVGLNFKIVATQGAGAK